MSLSSHHLFFPHPPIPILWVQSIRVNAGIAYWLALVLIGLHAFLALGICQFGLALTGPPFEFKKYGSYISHSSSQKRCLTLSQRKHLPENAYEA